jgi:hypothetical protein
MHTGYNHLATGEAGTETGASDDASGTCTAKSKTRTTIIAGAQNSLVTSLFLERFKRTSKWLHAPALGCIEVKGNTDS